MKEFDPDARAGCGEGQPLIAAGSSELNAAAPGKTPPPADPVRDAWDQAGWGQAPLRTALVALALGLAVLPCASLAGPQAGGMPSVQDGAAQAPAARQPASAKSGAGTAGRDRELAVQQALQEAARQSQARKAAAADAVLPQARGGDAPPAQARQSGGADAGQAHGRTGSAAEGGTSAPASRASQASLDRLLRLSPDARSRQGAKPSLRLKVVADAGSTLAFQQGFQSRYGELMAACERRALDFERIFDFQKLILDGRVLPPVIRWTGPSVVVDSPVSATAADATYVIERPARIVASAPGWREWLAVDAEPFEPDQALLPRSAEERRVWQEAVREGWEAGRAHASDIFDAAMARLEADYRGMLRFRMLVDRGLASAPVLAEGQTALSVMGERLSLNETTSRITVPASFEAAGRQPRAGRPGHVPLLPE